MFRPPPSAIPSSSGPKYVGCSSRTALGRSLKLRSALPSAPLTLITGRRVRTWGFWCRRLLALWSATSGHVESHPVDHSSRRRVRGDSAADARPRPCPRWPLRRWVPRSHHFAVGTSRPCSASRLPPRWPWASPPTSPIGSAMSNAYPPGMTLRLLVRLVRWTSPRPARRHIARWPATVTPPRCWPRNCAWSTLPDDRDYPPSVLQLRCGSDSGQHGMLRADSDRSTGVILNTEPQSAGAVVPVRHPHALARQPACDRAHARSAAGLSVRRDADRPAVPRLAGHRGEGQRRRHWGGVLDASADRVAE